MLRGISEIRAFFRTNQTPVYFVSPTAFNLLGIDRWLRNFFYVNYFDSFEGNHPRVFVPKERPYREFESMEDVCNYLLEHKEVLDLIDSRGEGGKVVFVMFDDETEQAAAAAGLEVAHPSAELRHRLDSKIVTTQLGNEAGVPSAPNTLGRATSYEELTALAEGAGLGDDLVVQTPYGDSGKTTFFIRGERDWDRYAGDMADQELKVMKRINNRAAAVEAVLTRHGTVVGPLMTDLTGHPELTPHKGGWCGNDIFPEVAVTRAPRARAGAHAEARRPARRRGLPRLPGDRLPRRRRQRRAVPGGDQPAHQRRDVDDQRDGRRLRRHAAVPLPPARVHGRRVRDRRRRHQPPLGRGLERRRLEPDHPQGHRRRGRAAQRRRRGRGSTGSRTAGSPSPAGGTTGTACTTTARPSSCACSRRATTRYPGADLGVLVARSRMQTEDNELTPRAHEWIDGVHAHFVGSAAARRAPAPTGALAFKTA